MKTIKQTYLVNSSLQEVWKALTNPKYIDAWGGGPAKMDDKVLINLLHTDVPDSKAKDIEKGWQEYYLGPLKKYLESK